MFRFNKIVTTLFLVISVVLLTSCGGGKKSGTTGWDYNNQKSGGFDVSKNVEQKTGPGLVLIEGGTFVMGSTIQDLLFDWNNAPRRITVPTFYIDETEVSNLDYLEYLYWLNRVFGENHPNVYRNALPDTNAWRDELAYNEPLVELYLRHPAYHDYPVVGVSWVQANDYCAWRTDRVNEMLLIEQGILEMDPDQKDENNFNTDAYLSGQYVGLEGKKQIADLNPSGTGIRAAKMEDGIMLPKYRLPTEAEWEYAALGLIGNTLYERVVERKTYPWSGTYTRSDEKKYYGQFMANFKRGRGDYMGVASSLNDGADIPAPVGSYWPNDYGLYNMAGNVSEWVLDVYRPMSTQDMSDYSPFRGNVFKNKALDFEDNLMEKDSLGRMRYDNIDPKNDPDRRNYREANNINYLDGDHKTIIDNAFWNDNNQDSTTKFMYDYKETTLINDEARVYKGGSWKDRAYYLSPGARRFLDQNQAADYIGFRCAMSRVGNPIPAKKSK